MYIIIFARPHGVSDNGAPMAISHPVSPQGQNCALNQVSWLLVHNLLFSSCSPPKSRNAKVEYGAWAVLGIN